MGQTFSVTPEDLSSAGGVVNGGGTTLELAGIGLTGTTITQAGFQSAEALTSCCTAWSSALQATGGQLYSLADRLNGTASTYSDTETSLEKLDSPQSFLD